MRQYQLDVLMQWMGSLAVLIFLTVLAFRWARRVADQRHELRMKILERFSSEELVNLLTTEGGRKWLADALSGRSDPVDLIALAHQRAILLTCLGLGLLGTAAALRSEMLLVLGILLLVGALGLRLSAVVAARKRKPSPPPREEG
jgi:hypothetical protein